MDYYFLGGAQLYSKEMVRTRDRVPIIVVRCDPANKLKPPSANMDSDE